MPKRFVAPLPLTSTLSRRTLLTTGLAAGLAACNGAAPFGVDSGANRFGRGSTVTVGVLLPYGSPDSGQQVLAQSLENAARLAVSDTPRLDIALRVFATEGRPDRALEASRAAVDAGAQILLGPVLAAEASAVGPAVAARGIPVLSFSNTTTVAGGNVFLLGMTFDNTARRLLGWAQAAGRRRIMIVAERNARGAVATAAIRRGAAAAGVEIVAAETYEFSQAGVVNALPALVETARASGAEALFFTDDTAGALPIVTQLLVDNRIGPPTFQFIGLTRWDIPPASLQLRGLQDGWFAVPDPALAREFEARYFAAYGSAPHPIAGLAYDGIAAIAALLAGGRPDPFSRAALTQPAGFAGVYGIFRFLPDGTSERGLAVATIRDRSVVILDPAPRSFAGVGA